MKSISPILDDLSAQKMSALFDSLSDPTRIKILSVLMAGEVNVGDLAEDLNLSPSAVSHQLRGLKDKHVIRTRKQGKQVFVALEDDHIRELFERGLEHIEHE